MKYEGLNLTEICRCCKQTESGMISIFDGKAHSTYPPVVEMLSRITLLSLQQNDGLPSLVCILCLSSIRLAYTFIQRIIQIDAQLQQILLAQKKQADTISTEISTEALGKDDTDETFLMNVHLQANESEDLNHSLIDLKVEDLDEPLQNCYQHDQHVSAATANIVIDLIVKSEDVLTSEIEETQHICEMCNQTFKTARILEIHRGENDCFKSEPSLNEITITSEVIQLNRQRSYKDTDTAESSNDIAESNSQEMTTNLATNQDSYEGNESYQMISLAQQELKPPEIIKQSSTNTGNENVSIKDDLLTNSNKTDLDTANTAKNCNAAELVEVIEICPNPNSPTKRRKTLNIQDSEEASNLEVDLETEEICPKFQTIQTKRLKIVYKCNQCSFTSVDLYNLRQHLPIHFKHNAFPCSKCNRTFSQSNKHFCKEIATKKVISLTPPDLKDQQGKDSENMKKSSTYTGNEHLNIKDSLLMNSLEATLEGNNSLDNSNSDKNLDTPRYGKEAELIEVLEVIEDICPKRRKTLQDSEGTSNPDADAANVGHGTRSQTVFKFQTDCVNGKTDYKPYVCLKCNRVFRYKATMGRHRRTCDGGVERSQKLSKPSKQSKSNTSTVLWLMCKLCDFTTAQMPNLEEHLSIHLEDYPFPSNMKEDLTDPLKMKKYYTSTKIDM